VHFVICAGTSVLVKPQKKTSTEQLMSQASLPAPAWNAMQAGSLMYTTRASWNGCHVASQMQKVRMIQRHITTRHAQRVAFDW